MLILNDILFDIKAYSAVHEYYITKIRFILYISKCCCDHIIYSILQYYRTCIQHIGNQLNNKRRIIRLLPRHFAARW